MRHRSDRARTFRSQAQSFCPRPKVRRQDKFEPGPNSPLPTSPTAASCPPHPPRGTSSGRQSGRSSGVEHNLAKVGVEGSNPFARSKNRRNLRFSKSSVFPDTKYPDIRIAYGYPDLGTEFWKNRVLTILHRTRTITQVAKVVRERTSSNQSLFGMEESTSSSEGTTKSPYGSVGSKLPA